MVYKLRKERDFVVKEIAERFGSVGFDDTEIAMVKELYNGDSAALSVIKDIIDSRPESKDTIIEVLHELYKSDLKGSDLVRLYETFNRDPEMLIWHVQNTDISMLRNDYD